MSWTSMEDHESGRIDSFIGAISRTGSSQPNKQMANIVSKCLPTLCVVVVDGLSVPSEHGSPTEDQSWIQKEKSTFPMGPDTSSLDSGKTKGCAVFRCN